MLNLQETSTTIKASELRFGNLIKYYDELVEVYGVKGLYVIIAVEENGEVKEQSILAPAFEPIPLTHELIVKCGFIWQFGNVYDLNLGSKGIRIQGHSVIYRALNMNWVDIDVDVYHLHQLQNLYLALTGEELQVNL